MITMFNKACEITNVIFVASIHIWRHINAASNYGDTDA